MNYRDYVEILLAENLPTTHLADWDLGEAIFWQKQINALKKFDEDHNKGQLDIQAKIKECEEKKISHILAALEMNEAASRMPDVSAYGDKQFLKLVPGSDKFEKMYRQINEKRKNK